MVSRGETRVHRRGDGSSRDSFAGIHAPPGQWVNIVEFGFEACSWTSITRDGRRPWWDTGTSANWRTLRVAESYTASWRADCVWKWKTTRWVWWRRRSHVTLLERIKVWRRIRWRCEREVSLRVRTDVIGFRLNRVVHFPVTVDILVYWPRLPDSAACSCQECKRWRFG